MAKRIGLYDVNSIFATTRLNYPLRSHIKKEIQNSRNILQPIIDSNEIRKCYKLQLFELLADKFVKHVIRIKLK